jgi:acetoacetyl-CoA synthetase
MKETPKILWNPGPLQQETSILTGFKDFVGRQAEDYDQLWRWSVTKPEEFWRGVWDYTGVIAEGDVEPVLQRGESIRQSTWFPRAKLNHAENLLHERPRDSEALVFRAEGRFESRLSFGELCDRVSVLAQALRAKGVEPGDRVAAVLPSCPEEVSQGLLQCLS